MKVLFHCHTEFSPDSKVSLEELYNICKKENIECIIITDHNTINGGVNFKKYLEEKNDNNIKVIIASEIESDSGEIIGVFLKEEIAEGLTPKQTVEEIKKQGGVVIIPHPFDRIRSSAIKREALLEIIEHVDILESFNARVIIKSDNKKTCEFAKEYNKLTIIGTDAHIPSEYKLAFLEMQDFNSKEEFLQHLKEAKYHIKRSLTFFPKISIPALFVGFKTKFYKIKRKFLKFFN